MRKRLSSGNFLVLQLHQSQIDYYSEYFTLIDGVVGGDQFSKFQTHITTQHTWRKKETSTHQVPIAFIVGGQD